jgi:hypothetical protein
MPGPLPSKSFPIHYIDISLDVTQSVILRARLEDRHSTAMGAVHILRLRGTRTMEWTRGQKSTVESDHVKPREKQ